MERARLIELIKERKSFLCVGLDSDPSKIPSCLQNEDNPILAFNKAIIDATRNYAVAYKPNIAFYEAMGASGWETLMKTIEYIGENHFIIADAKRGDIGNTSNYYAKAYFEKMNCDAITVSPYMGRDSVTPYLQYSGKWAIILGLTSNEGALDFQTQLMHTNRMLFQKVLAKSKEWGTDENTMYVIGATRAEMLSQVRDIVPNHFLLIPGVGAQGGSLQEVAQYGMNKECGLLVNASRSIIYTSGGGDFANAAGLTAKKIQEEMEVLLQNAGIAG
ncbi:MAG: orotidine-5'-phosphate decarboxylase [Flavobacteriales bacterium]